jgi:hypothetical protein
VLYSDGLVERRAVPLNVGMSELTSVPIVLDAEPEAMCEQLVDAMLAEGTNPDDVTCLLLQVASRPPAVIGGLAPRPAGTPTTC